VFHKLGSDPPIGRWFEFILVLRGSLKIQMEKIRVFQTNSKSRVETIEVDEAVQVELFELFIESNNQEACVIKLLAVVINSVAKKYLFCLGPVS